eukprot:g31327.t1
MAPDEKVEFTRKATGAQLIKPPAPERQKTLLGELLFLRVWHLLKKNAEPLKVSAKVVGTLLQLPLVELEEMVAAQSKFQHRLSGVLKTLGIQMATEGPEGEALPVPPVQRQGELLYVALMLGENRWTAEHRMAYLSFRQQHEGNTKVLPVHRPQDL